MNATKTSPEYFRLRTMDAVTLERSGLTVDDVQTYLDSIDAGRDMREKYVLLARGGAPLCIVRNSYGTVYICERSELEPIAAEAGDAVFSSQQREEGERIARIARWARNRAERSKRAIQIYRDGVWAGTGAIDEDNVISDCGAVLGNNQDESDATYDAITDAIDNDEESVKRPDGLYTWEIGG
jgi:hypothetical protein